MNRSRPFEPPDTHHLKAGWGWLELGDHIAANEELEKISPELRAHPDALELRWQIYAKAKHWEAALDIGRALAQLVPASPVGWINQAYALHAMKRTKEAWDTLLPVAEQFVEPTGAYNLACYAAQLGNLTIAQEWLRTAFEIGGTEFKLMALADEDLQPLWDRIAQM